MSLRKMACQGLEMFIFIIIRCRHACVCVVSTLCTVLMYAQVKGHSVFDCWNETVAVRRRLWTTDDVYLCLTFGYVWLVWCWLKTVWVSLTKVWIWSVWMFDWLHSSHTIWTRPCMTLPRTSANQSFACVGVFIWMHLSFSLSVFV